MNGSKPVKKRAVRIMMFALIVCAAVSLAACSSNSASKEASEPSPAASEATSTSSSSAQSGGQDSNIFDVEYQDGVIVIPTSDATVSEDGHSAVISKDAIDTELKPGEIVAIVDDYLQGTAIKIDSIAKNSDGSYSISGQEPQFEEVFKSLHIAGTAELEDRS